MVASMIVCCHLSAYTHRDTQDRRADTDRRRRGADTPQPLVGEEVRLEARRQGNAPGHDVRR